ncbi:hypothetical protein BDP27DRAFT_1494938 [Rhodocollybia butyracea]|uniref:Uncharacterized protein n=1 Tax=Rhodocollybia butyracea TaxID=206335 RepID=A0A9P5UAM4_9AGAR|nr:hypothetical protein BDP27DRAFT_1494938 [Rhodocollybia butyracea]
MSKNHENFYKEFKNSLNSPSQTAIGSLAESSLAALSIPTPASSPQSKPTNQSRMFHIGGTKAMDDDESYFGVVPQKGSSNLGSSPTTFTSSMLRDEESRSVISSTSYGYESPGGVVSPSKSHGEAIDGSPGYFTLRGSRASENGLSPDDMLKASEGRNDAAVLPRLRVLLFPVVLREMGIWGRTLSEQNCVSAAYCSLY